MWTQRNQLHQEPQILHKLPKRPDIVQWILALYIIVLDLVFSVAHCILTVPDTQQRHRRGLRGGPPSLFVQFEHAEYAMFEFKAMI